MVLGTAKASTSGTSVDFTDIPSWVKRVTVAGSGVSISGTSFIIVQLGTSSGYVTSGYLGSDGNANRTTGLSVDGSNVAAASRHFVMPIVSLGNDTWVFTSVSARSEAAQVTNAGGSIDLGGTLDRIRITTVNGADTFDAGTINLLLEG
jgi:hypothetical protein